MTNPMIGFIGFGEAAYLISEGLKQEGVEHICAYDVNANDSYLGPAIRESAVKLSITLFDSMELLINHSDMIICATSAKVAERIAKDVKDSLTSNKIYVDLNATSPMTKEKMASYVEEAGARFVDAAVMESVPLKKHKVPIYISGSGAKAFQTIGQKYGMNLTYISEQAGSSSAIKMIRSVFMKGFTMLLLETLQSSEKYGVTDTIMYSIEETIQSKKLEDIANTLINRTAIHAERRVAEMNEVIQTLDSIKVNSLLSQSVKQKLTKLVELNIRERLDNEVPKHYLDVLKELNDFE